jgi:tetratricopeptide (TPR) repeat protein
VASLKGYENLYGRKSLRFASALDNLSIVYKHMTRYQEAESLALQSLEIYESILDPEAPDVETVLFNLADLYRTQGKVIEGMAYFKRAMLLSAKTIGKMWEADLSLGFPRSKSEGHE